MFLALCLTMFQLTQPGEWPEPRQNGQLTGVQSLPGAMSEAPSILASYDLGRGYPNLSYVRDQAGNRRGVCLVAGELFCYDEAGTLVWSSHPENINYSSIVRLGDLNGDGAIDILLKAGRSSEPYGAIVLVSLESGEAVWRYDVEPMSYSWNCYVDDYRPSTASSEIVVVMMGYPPDADFGYVSFFDFEKTSATPTERWRYDFDAYTCFPSLLHSDIDGDGKQELAIETHSRMWFLDQDTGAVKNFTQWDVAPANVRSYGLVKFVDLNFDGREDFLCLANFAQHHEVILNKGGAFEKAWHYGWPESVTTGKVQSNWPEPAYADVDGNTNLEIVVSMFNSESKSQWLMRVYDGVSGEMEYRIEGYVAKKLIDTQSDEGVLVLAHRSDDPTLSAIQGTALFRLKAGKTQKLWEGNGYLVPAGSENALTVSLNGDFFELSKITADEWKPTALPVASIQSPVVVVEDPVPAPQIVGAQMPELMAANLTKHPNNELLLYRGEEVKIVRYTGKEFEDIETYTSSCIPVLADLDGDELREVITLQVGPSIPSVITAHTPGRESKRLWSVTLPPTDRTGLPQPRTAYMRSGHFTGGATPDLYVWVGTPFVRSMVISGKDGRIIWERGEMDGQERYYGPSVNQASVWDYDGDGAEDLVFTNPDYYCVASGKTGELLVGPLFPPTIFDQPSQGLYTLPAVLSTNSEKPTVVLSSGHYFQGGLSLAGDPYWYHLPPTGENRCATEGFLPINDAWYMGVPRQNGLFACVDARDGSLRWETNLGASGSNVVAGDVDGDGRQEFLVGTSHHVLHAIGDTSDDEHPGARIVWTKKLDGVVGNPIVADLDGDGVSEIAVPTQNGYVHILGKASGKDE